MDKPNRLYPEDQARVDEYLRSGYNSVERKPFRPLYMMILLVVTTLVCSGLAVLITQLAGIV